MSSREINSFDEEFLSLVHGHLDGSLSASQTARLGECLAASPAAVDFLVRCARLEQLLDRRQVREQIDAEAERFLSALGLPTVAGASPVSAGSSDQSADLPVVPGSPVGLFGQASNAQSPLFPAENPAGGFGAFSVNFGLWGSLLSLVLLVAVGGLIMYSRQGGQPTEVEAFPRVASISSSVDALWSGEAIPDANGWLPKGAVHLRSGQAEIQFVSGAKVLLRAPAEFEAISPIEARLRSGSLTARVDGSKTTFRIYTPTAQVVDLGTEFGLSVAGSGETDVAVFDGMVDVASDPIPNLKKVEAATSSSVEKTPRRLKAGEALRVDWHGQFCRITTVTDEMFPLASAAPRLHSKLPPPLILDIRDTLRNADRNPKFYRIVRGGFGEDARAYVDRKYEWNGIDASGIPSFLLGADYIMPFNDDKDKNLKVLIPLARPATVYVLFDDRSPAPRWLKESFVNTGFHVGMDEDEEPSKKFARSHELGRGPGVSVDYVFSVWKRDVKEAGTIELGPQGGSRGGRSMYGIVVAPLDVGENVAEMHEVEDEKLR